MPEANRNPLALGLTVGHDIVPKPTAEYSIPAHKFVRATPGRSARWIFLPDLGRGEGRAAATSWRRRTSRAAVRLWNMILN